MFDRETVFILGAGASWHYGYPTGEELVRKIVDRARIASHFFRDSMQANPIRVDRPAYIKRDRPFTQSAVLFTNYGDINRINKKASKTFFGNFHTFLSPNPPTVGMPHGTYYCEKSTRDVYESLALDFDSLEEQ